MIKAGLTHNLVKAKGIIDLSGSDGDKIVRKLKEGAREQLVEGLTPALKSESTKGPRRSKKPWDTLARRLWNSFTGYTGDSYISKTKTHVEVGTTLPYHVYQARLDRDIGITDKTSDSILNIFVDMIMGILSKSGGK